MTRARIKRQYQFRLGGIVYIVVAIFIGLAAINSQANLLFWALGLMLGGLIVSGLVSGGMMLGLRVRRVLPENGAVDVPMTIHYEVINRKRLLPCFALVVEECEENVRLRGRPHAFCLHVGPKTTGRADAVTWPVGRGPVHFNEIRVGTTFPFGILRKSVVIAQPARVVVQPRTYRLKPALLARLNAKDHDGTRTTRQSGGDEEFFGLREYRDGDSLRFVHWRHSARIGQLVSREMTRVSPPRVMVVLDVRGRPEEDEVSERAISFAASLLVEAHRVGDEAGLVVVGARCPSFAPQHSHWHQVRMLQAMGELKLGEEDVPQPTYPYARAARWIVIHADQIDESVGPGRAVHLRGEDLEAYRMPDVRSEGGVAVRPATAGASGARAVGAAETDVDTQAEREAIRS